MDTSKRDIVSVQHRPGAVHLRLCRGERYNAIDTATLMALASVLARPVPSVLILEGEHGMFSVGPDIAELATLDGRGAMAFSRLAHQVIAALERWPGVTIANLDGFCLGSGLELALGCDVLVGSPDLRIGLPGLAWAMVPVMGGLRRLACRVPGDTSSALFLKGEVLDAMPARAMGLIDRLVAHPSELDQLREEMRGYSPAAVGAIRELRLRQQGGSDIEAEALLFAQPFASGECQRRLRALLAG